MASGAERGTSMVNSTWVSSANCGPRSTTLELVIWSCPVQIIIALSAVTWTSTHLLDPFRPLERISPGRPVPAGTKPLEIQAVALDWKWLFIYSE